MEFNSTHTPGHSLSNTTTARPGCRWPGQSKLFLISRNPKAITQIPRHRVTMSTRNFPSADRFAVFIEFWWKLFVRLFPVKLPASIFFAKSSGRNAMKYVRKNCFVCVTTTTTTDVGNTVYCVQNSPKKKKEIIRKATRMAATVNQKSKNTIFVETLQ